MKNLRFKWINNRNPMHSHFKLEPTYGYIWLVNEMDESLSGPKSG